MRKKTSRYYGVSFLYIFIIDKAMPISIQKQFIVYDSTLLREMLYICDVYNKIAELNDLSKIPFFTYPLYALNLG